MSNDVAMCTYDGITMHNDIAMILFLYINVHICVILLIINDSIFSHNYYIVTNYCILYVKLYIYLGKLKDKIKTQTLSLTFWGMCPTSNMYLK